MNERQSDNLDPDDLLSAYQDGELSAEERARLEGELRTSPEKQEVLRQYSQLSSWLKDLPREEVTANLQAEVMQRIQAPAGVVTTGAKRSSRVLWQVGISLSSVAALVLVMWFAAMPKGEKGPQLALNRDDRVATADLRTAKDNTAGNDGLDVAKNTPSAGMSSVQNTSANEGVANKKVESGVELGAPADFPFGPSDTLVRKGDSRGYQYSFEQDIAQLQPGQVVQALERAGDKVSVVTLSVVDRQEALNSLRVVLAKQAVSDEDAMMKSLAKRSGGGVIAGKSAKKTEAEQRDLKEQDFPLIAVYVQATGGQLEAAIKDLKSQEQQFLSLNVDSAALPGTEVEELVEEDERPLVSQEAAPVEDKKGVAAKPVPAPALKGENPPVPEGEIDPRRPREANRAKSLKGLFQLGINKMEPIAEKSVDQSLQQIRQRAVQLKRLPSQMDQPRSEAAEKQAPAQQNFQKQSPSAKTGQSPGAKMEQSPSTKMSLENRDRFAKPEKTAPLTPALKGEQKELKVEGKSELAAKESPEQPLKVLILLKQKMPHEAPISVPGGTKK